MERELIKDLEYLGYGYLPSLITTELLMTNVREQLQMLNNTVFPIFNGNDLLMSIWIKPATALLTKHEKYKTTTFTISCLTTNVFKTSIW